MSDFAPDELPTNPDARRDPYEHMLTELLAVKRVAQTAADAALEAAEACRALARPRETERFAVWAAALVGLVLHFVRFALGR